jgi:hypothetical protein
VKTTTKISHAIALHPADELAITVDRPMLVQVVNQATEEPVDVHMAKEWATAQELRAEVTRLRRLVKQLQWQLDNPMHEQPPQVYADDLMNRGTLAGGWAEVERSARECWRLIIETLTGRKGHR